MASGTIINQNDCRQSAIQSRLDSIFLGGSYTVGNPGGPVGTVGGPVGPGEDHLPAAPTVSSMATGQPVGGSPILVSNIHIGAVDHQGYQQDNPYMFPGHQSGLLLQQPLRQLGIAGSEQRQEAMGGHSYATTSQIGIDLSPAVYTGTGSSSALVSSFGPTQMHSSSVPWEQDTIGYLGLPSPGNCELNADKHEPRGEGTTQSECLPKEFGQEIQPWEDLTAVFQEMGDDGIMGMVLPLPFNHCLPL